MLKRQQILLEDWMTEYIRFLADTYDLSFSETIRIAICLETIDTMFRLFPRYKCALRKRELLSKLSSFRSMKRESEERHKLLSKIYFETRKAMEFRQAQGKKSRNQSA